MIPRSVARLLKGIYGRLAAPAQIRNYLAAHRSPRLNIGCGHNVIPGWLNVDLEGGRHGTTCMDATKRLPFPDDSFDAILCEHLIEHIPEADGQRMIRECLRILKPGGSIRLITPDLEALARLCIEPMDEARARYLAFVSEFRQEPGLTPADALNVIFYNYGHRYIYSIAKLRRTLAAAGFTSISEGRGGSSADPRFQDVEGHPGFMGQANAAFEAFALEASKPKVEAKVLAAARA
jgi:SAM-dependent methyltransferase